MQIEGKLLIALPIRQDARLYRQSAASASNHLAKPTWELWVKGCDSFNKFCHDLENSSYSCERVRTEND